MTGEQEAKLEAKDAVTEEQESLAEALDAEARDVLDDLGTELGHEEEKAD